MKKRVLSFVLAMAMLCAMAPVPAFADDPASAPEATPAADAQLLPGTEPAAGTEPGEDSGETPDAVQEDLPAVPEAPTDPEEVPDGAPSGQPEAGLEGGAASGTDTNGDGALYNGGGEPDSGDATVPAGDAVTPDTADEAQGSGNVARIFSVQNTPEPIDEPMGASELFKLPVSYRENGLSFYKPEVDELITDQNNMYVNIINLPDVKADPAAYIYRVTAPGVDARDFTGGQIKQARASSTSHYVYWEYKPAKAGEYTVTILKDGTEIAQGSVTIVAVQFDTGDKGKFDDGTTAHTSYYQKPSAKYSVMMDRHGTVPKVAVNHGETDQFIGWAAAKGVTESSGTLPYADLWTLMQDPKAIVENGVYTVYAAYGTRDIYDFTVKRGDTEVISYTALNVRADGAAATGNYDPADYTLTLTIENTGNKSLKISPLLSPSSFADVRYTGSDGKDAGLSAITIEAGKNGTIKVIPKKDLPPHDYSEALLFRVEERSLLFSVTVKFSVVSSTLVVEPAPLTKKYSETKGDADVTVSRIHYENSEVEYTGGVESLGIKFNSAGFKKEAEVGSYPYTIDTSTNPAYTVKLADPNALLVTVEPDTPAHSGITATPVHTDSPLSSSQLLGKFTNSSDPTLEVRGRLEWVDPEQRVGTGSRFTAQWKFTPEDTLNYTTATGEVDVVVSEKKATVFTLDPACQATVTYDGKPHEMMYTTNREDGTVPAPVQYKDSNGKIVEKPTDAGVYEVLVSIAESHDYAPAEMTDTLTIEPAPITLKHLSILPKTYDGQTKPVSCSHITHSVDYEGLFGDDDVTIEFDAAYETPDADGQARVIITMTGLTGADAGNYRLPENRVIHKYGTVWPKQLKITEKSFEKTYGQIRYLQASDFEIKGLVGGDDAKLTFTSDGERADASANGGTASYPITARLNNTNYTFSDSTGSVLVKNNIGNIVVNQAVPSGTVSAGVGKWSCELAHVSLTGAFVNPNNAEMTVPGKLEWAAEAPELLPEESEGKSQIKLGWVFTPDPPYNADYTTAVGTAVISLQAKEPVQITVDPKTEAADYTGEKHALTVTTKPATTVTVEYSKVPGDDWTKQPPIDAGTYTVRVTAAAVGDYAGNQITTHLVIAPAVPAITFDDEATLPDKTSYLTVPEGTPLTDASIRDKFTFKGIDGEEIPGALAWAIPEGVVTDDRQTFIWVFQPESSNYATVGGEVQFTLAEDERCISAEIYNLPAASGYQDYAVVDTKNLKAGDTVTFFKTENHWDAVSGSILVTDEDIRNGKLTVWLDDDALLSTGGTVDARISSSKKAPFTTLTYNAEPDFSLLGSDKRSLKEGLTLYAGKADSVLVAPNIPEYYKVRAVSVGMPNAPGLALCKAPDPANDDLTAVLRASEQVDTLVTFTVSFVFPDPARSSESIVISYDLRVACNNSGDITAGLDDSSFGNLPDVKVPDDETSIMDAVPLTAEDIEALDRGDSINYTLEVTGKDKGDVDPQTDIGTVDTFVADNLSKDTTVSCYIDINLTKTITDKSGGTKEKEVGETALPIRIIVSIPQEVRDAAGSGMVFSVIRVHHNKDAAGKIIGDPEVKQLDDLDTEPATVTFETDRFSTYALVYYPAPPAPPLPPASTEPEHRAEPANEAKDEDDEVTPVVKPVVTVPQTSDESSPALWAALFVFSALGLGVLGVLYAKRRKTK